MTARVYCKAWPNALGFDCTVNRVRFEVLSDRQLGRLVAFRKDGSSLTHSLRVFDRKGIRWANDLRTMALAVYRLWKDHRPRWLSHPD